METADWVELCNRLSARALDRSRTYRVASMGAVDGARLVCTHPHHHDRHTGKPFVSVAVPVVDDITPDGLDRKTWAGEALCARHLPWALTGGR